MGAAHHLGGLLGVDVGRERWIGKMPSVEKVVFPSSGPTLEPPDRVSHLEISRFLPKLSKFQMKYQVKFHTVLFTHEISKH